VQLIEEVKMVSRSYVDNQLRGLGRSFHLWGKSAINELPKIMVEGENIISIVNGRYDGGFAILCATDKRILLIDKKPLFLNLNDIRYDTVAEVDYNYRLLNAYLEVNTFGKTFRFRSVYQRNLREMCSLIQGKVLDLREKAKKKDGFSAQKVMQKAAEDIEKSIQDFAPKPIEESLDAVDIVENADTEEKPTSKKSVEFIEEAASRANKIGSFALD